ncbi:DUF695 domain-containing protein [Luteimonas saliphila]|uniref:DUF695 domain-containing protein n=1 Tax=Luteimonas saliphila TaxID=2804919 RepID=UPI00192DAE50
MDGRWDFYFLLVDDRPASIFVDLARIEHAPLARFPVMAWVSVEMRRPREDGLSGSDEFDALVRLEDAVVPALERDGGVLYVGRNTSAGRRDFYFYVADGSDWETRVLSAMRLAPDYRHEAGQRPDADWSVYRDFLYPRPRERHGMQNRSVCDALERQGDALVAAREIDHWAYFPDARGRDAFVAGALALDYRLREQADDADEGGERCMARVFRSDVPAHGAIDGICLPLYDLALECGGRYDGWECPVVEGGRLQ